MEREELQAALRQDPALQQEYAVLRQAWRPKTGTQPAADKTINHILARARQQEATVRESQPEIVPLHSSRFRKITWIAAASVLLIVMAAVVFNQDKPATPVAQAPRFTDSITTQNGNRSHLILPDGSRVWLNSGSRLLYQKDFTGRLRQVELIGEAYFDVVKMPEKPFIVHAGGVRIKVLGTSFNVKCYPKDKRVETTLLHGAVAVSHADDPTQGNILLKPNEKLSLPRQFPVTVTEKTAGFLVEKIDTSVQPSRLPETAWVYNRLEFRNDDFETLAVKMERWYNVQIVFNEERLKKLRFIGSFENETVNEALAALQAVSRFNYKIKGNEILVGASH